MKPVVSGQCSVSIDEQYSTVTVLPIRLQTICELIVISKNLELASKSLLMKRTQKLELIHLLYVISNYIQSKNIENGACKFLWAGLAKVNQTLID